MSDAAADLLLRMTGVFASEDGMGTSTGAAAKVADDAWPAMQQREPSIADAEACRIAQLSSAMAENHTATRLWRARSLARAVAVGWREGVAALIMSDAFTLLAQANDDYARGRTIDVMQPAPAARGVIEAVLTALPNDQDASEPPARTAPSLRSMRRMVEEKTGFLLLLEGAHAQARDAYARAAHWAEGRERDELKVALGAALVDYLDPRDDDEAADARVRTKSLAGRATAADIADLSATATHNAAVMAEGGKALRPYEIL